MWHQAVYFLSKCAPLLMAESSILYLLCTTHLFTTQSYRKKELLQSCLSRIAATLWYVRLKIFPIFPLTSLSSQRMIPDVFTMNPTDFTSDLSGPVIEVGDFYKKCTKAHFWLDHSEQSMDCFSASFSLSESAARRASSFLLRCCFKASRYSSTSVFVMCSQFAVMR